jgi:hypothetical protein
VERTARCQSLCTGSVSPFTGAGTRPSWVIGAPNSTMRHRPRRGALVSVKRFHHVLEDRVEQVPGLLGIAVGERLHRSFQVGELHRHWRAPAFENALGSQHPSGRHFEWESLIPGMQQ